MKLQTLFQQAGGKPMDFAHELRRIANDDRAAFSRVYLATRLDFVRYATGLLAGDREAAEDAVDEAFIAIWQQAGRYDGAGHAMGWMRRIVRNKAIDWLRKQRETVSSDSPELANLTDQIDDGNSPFENAAQSSTAKALHIALALLSVEQREALWMCYFEERPLREIAQWVGCPENTIKTRLFHARRILKESHLLDTLALH
jgi:RNA polymerase sigma-70 factor, ECF subfamily